VSSLQSRVLLVDDEPSIRRALHTTLSALGFDIEEASGGEQAVSFVRTERYDAALLDINMPGMGGIEACRTIRRLCPRLPILMLLRQQKIWVDSGSGSRPSV
jgi:two-component system KDP operon response regulator KdpE